MKWLLWDGEKWKHEKARISHSVRPGPFTVAVNISFFLSQACPINLPWDTLCAQHRRASIFGSTKSKHATILLMMWIKGHCCCRYLCLWYTKVPAALLQYKFLLVICVCVHSAFSYFWKCVFDVLFVGFSSIIAVLHSLDLRARL